MWGSVGYCIFNKNQFMLAVRKSIAAQIKENNFVLFVTNHVELSDTPLCAIIATVMLIQNCKTFRSQKLGKGSVLRKR